MRSHRDETTEGLEWGDLLIEFETFPAGLDTAPLLRGLPGDACSCPHWGYVLRGSFVVRYGDREETISAGDAFYLEPGHVPVFLEETEMFEVSPAQELRAVMEIVTKNASELEDVTWR
ncbi:cupin domain-containing protein [Nocardioides sp. HM23]|uniref:AraC family ligand binding domain-containing protein n=1 Tax=Nocardioides bizhenqiangii TaxID=3095076 RepID=UPI002ACA739F|nr:AraC family ligand binding domain-containing protein [Nocardioides sp. HM23]MDZ5621296.1 cupin domain-containing protein [Nocardioides sp. HM23]